MVEQGVAQVGPVVAPAVPGRARIAAEGAAAAVLSTRADAARRRSTSRSPPSQPTIAEAALAPRCAATAAFDGGLGLVGQPRDVGGDVLACSSARKASAPASNDANDQPS